MKIIKRDKRVVRVDFNKILNRISDLCKPIDESYTVFPLISTPIDTEYVDPSAVAQKVIEDMCDNITTQELDAMAAEYAANIIVKHPDFGRLAARILISNIHKRTREWAKFSQATEKMWFATHPLTNEPCPAVSKEYYDTVMINAERLDTAIDHTMDYNYNHFGVQTLEYSYLTKIGKDATLVERPQHMLMRVAVGIHGNDIDAAIETYDLLSKHYFTHASPTIFNAGTANPQLSSCFLNMMKEDSIKGIFLTLGDVAIISKGCGGIGMHLHNLRATGSHISSSNGTSPGIMAFMKPYNETIKAVSQGGNKRKGALAFYFEPWHADVIDMVECRRTNGNEEIRTRDLFPALWIPDLFMERVRSNDKWTLMCPAKCPGLSDVYGKDFEELYTKYEKEGRGNGEMDAQELWRIIIVSKIETGTPYICFKDTVNQSSNHSNIGVIKSSNLCTEIVQYSDENQTAVCNLASLAVNRFIKEDLQFDFDKLKKAVRILVRNLDKVVDITDYPTREASSSNFATRPMGLGVQGLADLFFSLRIPFVSEQARILNKQIFETIYYAALDASCDLAKEKGAYPLYEGSPLSKGIFHFEMNRKKSKAKKTIKPDPHRMHDWEALRSKILQHGIRNSMLVAPMPTASTAQILGNNESFEPCTSNMFSRIVLSGPAQVVNEFMVRDMLDLGIWNEATRAQIIMDGGSVQNVKGFPDHLKEVYKTVWEIDQSDLIKMAAERGQYVDQAQSFNMYVSQPSVTEINHILFKAWKAGLKTVYYLRTRPASDPVQFTLDRSLVDRSARHNFVATANKKNKKKDASAPTSTKEEKQRRAAVAAAEAEAQLVCSLKDPGACMSCSG